MNYGLEVKEMNQQDTANRDRLDNLINKAGNKEVMSQEEVGFVVMLVERFRSDLDTKTDQLLTLKGEINQLRANERVIMDIVKNLVSAADREANRLKAEKALRQDANNQKDDR